MSCVLHQEEHLLNSTLTMLYSRSETLVSFSLSGETTQVCSLLRSMNRKCAEPATGVEDRR